MVRLRPKMPFYGSKGKRVFKRTKRRRIRGRRYKTRRFKKSSYKKMVKNQLTPEMKQIHVDQILTTAGTAPLPYFVFPLLQPTYGSSGSIPLFPNPNPGTGINDRIGNKVFWYATRIRFSVEAINGLPNETFENDFPNYTYKFRWFLMRNRNNNQANQAATISSPVYQGMPQDDVGVVDMTLLSPLFKIVKQGVSSIRGEAFSQVNGYDFAAEPLPTPMGVKLPQPNIATITKYPSHPDIWFFEKVFKIKKVVTYDTTGNLTKDYPDFARYFMYIIPIKYNSQVVNYPNKFNTHIITQIERIHYYTDG